MARRVARNSLLPFAAGMAGRVLALVLAMVMARTLGASGSGLYAVAVNLWLYASIVVDFGLGTWLTREVAAAPGGGQGHRRRRPRAAPRPRRLALPLLLLAALGAGFVQGSGPGRGAAGDGGPAGRGAPAGGRQRRRDVALLRLRGHDLSGPGAAGDGRRDHAWAGAVLLLAGFDVVALAWVSLAVNLLTAAVFAVACARRYVPLRASLHPAAPAGPGPGGPAL